MASNIHRVTISVPQALRERMEAVKGQVNWSAVATAAFEAKLLEIELSKKRGNMSKADVVKRLKAAAAEDHREDYEDGKAAGRAWAAETATPKELRRLAEYIEQAEAETGNRVEWWDVDHPGWMAPFGAPDYLVFAVRPKRADERDAPAEFWEQALEEADRGRVWDSDFLRGFGEGAAEVWSEVRGEL
jgi:hypothetical protein